MTKTLVTFLLDRSGSMEKIKDSTIDAFNAYLEGLKGDDNIFLNFILFDSFSLDKIHVNMPIAEVPPLDTTVFMPRGGTPLIDATYKTIKAVEKSMESAVHPAVAAQGISSRPTKVVICIQTDGQENQSREYTLSDLNTLIAEKIAAGWEFVFMGAGIDAYEQGRRMGIDVGSTISYDSADAGATMDAFTETAANTRSYASGVSMSMGYSGEQKRAAGDKYVPQDGDKTPKPATQGAAVARVKKTVVEDFTL